MSCFSLCDNRYCASITRIYGFYDERKRWYNNKVCKHFSGVFNTFPVCGLSDEEVVRMHCGRPTASTTSASAATISR